MLALCLARCKAACACSCMGEESPRPRSMMRNVMAGNIAAWNKKEGDEVAAGDSIADIETDKATMTWEAQDEGVVAKILVPAGSSDVQVGAPVAVFVEEQVRALCILYCLHLSCIFRSVPSVSERWSSGKHGFACAFIDLV